LLAEGGTAIQTKMVREFQRAGARLVSELNVNFLKSSANFLCDATRPGAPEVMDNLADPRLVWIATVLAAAVFVLYVTHV